MSLSEFAYTVLLKNASLKSFANKIILSLLPTTTKIGPAIVHINPTDPVISGALTLGVFERHEIAFFLRSCREGMTVVDVGANVGIYTAIAMHLTKAKGKIISIEPHPESLKYLTRTVDANKLVLSPEDVPFVQIEAVAASCREDIARLFVNPNNKGDNRLYVSDITPAINSTEVRTRTIDGILKDLGIKTMEYLKLDVQGCELDVLEGAENTIRASPSVIILSEFWPDGLRRSRGQDAATRYLELLKDLDFKTYQLKRNGLRPLRGQHDVESMIRKLKGRQYTNIVCLKAVSTENLSLGRGIRSAPTLNSRT